VRGLNNNSGNNPNGRGEMGCADYVRAWWEKNPLFVRIVIILSAILWVASFTKLVIPLINIPKNTILHFFVWSVVTSVLVNTSIINVLFAFLSWVPSATIQETHSGTIKYMLNFFLHSTIIQITYCAVAVLSWLTVTPALMSMPSTGLWPLVMAEITLNCCLNPEKQYMMMCLPWPIQAKYYPWALVAFFTVINMFQPQFDVIVGVIYGYLYFYYLSSYLVISDNFCAKVSECFPFKYLKGMTGYVQASGSGVAILNNNQPQRPARPAPTSNNSQVVVQAPANQAPTVTAFKGKGTVVGSTPSISNNSVLVTTDNNDNTSSSTEQKDQKKKPKDTNYHQLQEEDV